MNDTIRWGMLWLVMGGLSACAGEGSSDEDGTETETETALDADTRTVVLEKLGSLPAAPPADPTNRWADDPAAATLGQALFFDARYSENGQISCATCHDPAAGFQDPRANTSEGLAFTGRAAPSVINAAYGSLTPGETVWHFWDGRTDSQWAQVLGPPESGVEMGGTRTRVAYLLHDEYRSEYEAIFGAMPELHDAEGEALYPDEAMPGTDAWDALDAAAQHDINEIYANFGKAIAAYERLIVSRDSRFDQFYEELAAGADDSDVLTEQEKQGLALFVGKANCVACHSGPNFTDWAFYNLAIDQIGDNLPELDDGRMAGVEAVRGDVFNCAGEFSDHPDKSQCAVEQLTSLPLDLGAFKTPSLRSVSQTAPYMHTGTFETLEDVLVHYEVGGGEGAYAGEASPKLIPYGVSEGEREALVAFLKTLDGAPLDPALLGAPAR